MLIAFTPSICEERMFLYGVVHRWINRVGWLGDLWIHRLVCCWPPGEGSEYLGDDGIEARAGRM